MERQKGFTIVEGLLIVIVVTVVGFGGYTVLNNQRNKNTEEMETVQQKQEPTNSNQTQEITTVSYDTWTEADRQYENEDVVALYNSKTGTSSLRVYGENNPRLYYSSNAPVYCRLESGGWQHYQAFSNSNPSEYVKDDTSNACEKIELAEINGLKAYTRYGGALGQIKYTAAIEVSGKWFVFSDHENYDADKETNSEISDAAYEEINERLMKSVNQRASETFASPQ